ncbi:unnamed protein product [Ascophyllum nodosum]
MIPERCRRVQVTQILIAQAGTRYKIVRVLVVAQDDRKVMHSSRSSLLDCHHWSQTLFGATPYISTGFSTDHVTQQHAYLAPARIFDWKFWTAFVEPKGE